MQLMRNAIYQHYSYLRESNPGLLRDMAGIITTALNIFKIGGIRSKIPLSPRDFRLAKHLVDIFFTSGTKICVGKHMPFDPCVFVHFSIALERHIINVLKINCGSTYRYQNRSFQKALKHLMVLFVYGMGK